MSRISTRRLAQFCRRVGSSLRAGLDARSVLQRESESGSGSYRSRLTFISRRLAGGDTLTDSVAATGDFFPLFFRAMVNVGETSGRMDEVLLRVADHYERVLKLRRTFLAGILWPAVQLSIAIVVIGLLIFILGILAPDKDVIGFGVTGNKALGVYILSVLGIAALIAAPILLVQRRGLGSGVLLHIVLATPVVGKWLHTMALSRMAWALSLAHGAGMEIRRTVRYALLSTQNPYYTTHCAMAERVIQAGGEVHEALRKTGAFPSDFLMAVETGETSGQLAESMHHLAQDYDARAEAASNVFVQLAAFAVWGLVAIILIYFIIRLYIVLVINTYYEYL